MAIRIGQTPPRPSSTKAVIPPNRGMSSVVQARIDTLARSAARKTAEAVRADGYSTVVWIKNPQATVECSCRSSFVYSKANVNEPEVVEAQEAPTKKSVFVDNDPSQIGVTWSGTGVDKGELFSNVLGYTTPEFIAPSTKVVSGDTKTVTHEVPITEFTELDGELVASSTSSEPETDFDDAFASLFPFINDATPCGICGGIGKVNGYSYSSGVRFLFRVADSPDVSGKFVEVDGETKPSTIRILRASGYVEWVWKIPPYFDSVRSIRVRNNTDTVTTDIVVWSEEDNDWVLYTPEFMEQFRSVGGDMRCRILGSQVEIMTHVEMLLDTIAAPFVQLPQLQKDSGGDAIEALVQSDFELEPNVPYVSRGSIIDVPSLGRSFLVTSVTNKMTAKRFVFGITGNVRLIQPTEHLALFGMTTSWRGNGNASYAGLKG